MDNYYQPDAGQQDQAEHLLQQEYEEWLRDPAAQQEYREWLLRVTHRAWIEDYEAHDHEPEPNPNRSTT